MNKYKLESSPTGFAQLLVIIALIASVVVWLMLINNIMKRAAPPNDFAFYANDIPLNDMDVFCDNYIQDLQLDIWRSCVYSPHDKVDRTSNQVVMVRYDLNEGRADMNWVFPEVDEDTDMVGAIPLDDGDWVVALLTPEMRTSIYRVLANGGVESLYTSENTDIILGMEQVDEAVEFVTVSHTDYAEAVLSVRRLPLVGGDAATRSIEKIDCTNYAVCFPEFAYHDAAGWHVVHIRVAELMPRSTSSDIVVSSENRQAQITDTIEITEDIHYTLEDSPVYFRHARTLLTETSNLLFPQFVSMPYESDDVSTGNWRAFTTPDIVNLNADRLISADFRLNTDGTYAMQLHDGFHDGIHARIDDSWLEISNTEGAVTVHQAEVAASSHAPVMNVDSRFTLANLVSRPEGGYYVLYRSASYITLDETFQRIDNPGFLGRLLRLLQADLEFSLFEDYTRNPYIRAISLSLMVLGMPIAVLLVGLSFLLRPRDTHLLWQESLVARLAPFALCYLVVLCFGFAILTDAVLLI